MPRAPKALVAQTRAATKDMSSSRAPPSSWVSLAGVLEHGEHLRHRRLDLRQDPVGEQRTDLRQGQHARAARMTTTRMPATRTGDGLNDDRGTGAGEHTRDDEQHEVGAELRDLRHADAGPRDRSGTGPRSGGSAC